MKEILDGFWEMTKIASMQVLEYVVKKIDQMRKGIAKRGKEKNKEKVKREKKRNSPKSFVEEGNSQIQEDSKIDEPISKEKEEINSEMEYFCDVQDGQGLPKTNTKSEKKEQIQPYQPNKQLELFFSDQNGLQISGIAEKEAGMCEEPDQQEQIDLFILTLLNQEDKMLIQLNNPLQNKITSLQMEKENQKEWWQRIVEGYKEEDSPVKNLLPIINMPLEVISERDSEDQEGSSVNPNDLLVDQKDLQSEKMKKTKKIKHIASFPSTSRRRLRVINLIDLVTDEDKPQLFQIPLCTKVYD